MLTVRYDASSVALLIQDDGVGADVNAMPDPDPR